MSTFADGRDHVIGCLRRELVGPDPKGQALDLSKPPSFPDEKAAAGPWRNLNGEEILTRDTPKKRYGIGVLYPARTLDLDDNGAGIGADEEKSGVAPAKGEGEPSEAADGATFQAAIEGVPEIGEGKAGERDSQETDDAPIVSANTYQPSSIAVTFLTVVPAEGFLEVRVRGGRYRQLEVEVGTSKRRWWVRSGVDLVSRFSGQALLTQRRSSVAPVVSEGTNTEGLDLEIQVVSRPSEGGQLLTVCLVNRGRLPALAIDEKCLFQCEMEADFHQGGARQPSILPYPSTPMEARDEEEQSLALLYRSFDTFAVGHGCAADWSAAGVEGRVLTVSAQCLPVVETASITPEVLRDDGTPIEVPMTSLAGLKEGDDGMEAVREVADYYGRWLDQKEKEASLLPTHYQVPAMAHIAQGRTALGRILEGMAFLNADPLAMKAFRLANYAVLLQQVQSRRDVRKPQFDNTERRLVYPSPYRGPNTANPPAERGKWRPFQIAFLLLSLESAANPHSLHRNTVELIWFPTGGGKTEAYLALTAFTIFLRRLRDQDDLGVDVLMRYTLRLLTAQQFQRAAGLVCAMEFLRKGTCKGQLGDAPFSIGIWLGSSMTPNDSESAKADLKTLLRDPKERNPFLLTKCPWCGAQMGPVDLGKAPPTVPRIHGYQIRNNTVEFNCPDAACSFSSSLPVLVIDTEIYKHRPSLVIGTVDKFAMLAWVPDARSLFGLSENGSRVASPPNLVIQDELHLISGPLGTMVGLFEGVVEELCTDRRRSECRPKIVCSTATIRKFPEQVLGLYGRKDSALFPPPGLEAGDSFFATYARRADGSLMPGRKYVGIHAPALGSLQTVQVRTFSALLQAPVELSQDEQDPWWTLLAFFNSLRELGTSVSLFQSDILDYLKVIRFRQGLDVKKVRRLSRIRELTGRLSDEQIPAAIEALEVPTGPDKKPVDTCLASSIIEVGIDIDRLSLMTVVGQPKTTSQYIQVTGRVGRKWKERPGLVVTIYSASKPRDRSHFEKFRTYHETLYAQVEPTSVTPFSPPALDRALHAVMAAFVRQAGTKDEALSPWPFPKTLLDRFEQLYLSRVDAVDPEERITLQELLRQRQEQWKRWERTLWKAGPTTDEIPLLRVAGAYCTTSAAQLSWPTQQSMRNVDAECQIQITTRYNLEEVTHG